MGLLGGKMYIKRICIENIKCFGKGENAVDIDLQRPDGSYAGLTVLAGRNGSGKSTLLRAIALAVAGPVKCQSLQASFLGWVTRNEKECRTSTELTFCKEDKFDSDLIQPNGNSFETGLVWQYPEEKSEPKITTISYPRKEEKNILNRLENGLWSENSMGWFIAGYGPFRHLPAQGTDVYMATNRPRRFDRLASLFREDISLSEAISWLKEINYRRLEKRPGAQEIEDGILALLDDGLLPGGMKVQKVDSDGLWVTLNGQELPLKELSDGYRTVAALVVDLARQLFETYGEFKISKNNGNIQVPYPGVVLIDEIDAHLHISWQQQIGTWLKNHFPALQFIVSTHSPFICQAADPRGLLRLPTAGEGRTVEHVSEELFKIVKNGSIDESVLTELFGLETSHSLASEKIQEELAKLEVLVIRGKATPTQKKQYKELSGQLPHTQRQLVQQALRTLQKNT
jgi:predicted ATP-dependent endonuclease of OLD family